MLTSCSVNSSKGQWCKDTRAALQARLQMSRADRICTGTLVIDLVYVCVYNLLAGSISLLGVVNIRKAMRGPDTEGPLREAIDCAAWPAQSCTYKCSRSSIPPTPSL